MKVGKQAEKKELTKKQRVNRDRFKKAIICFIISIVLFAALLVFQTSILKQESKTKVYKAASELLEDTEITAENFPNLFYESYVVSSEVENGAIESPEAAYGMFLERDMAQNEVLTSHKIGENLTNILEHMEKPVKLSFEASSVVNAVAGEIRKGDLVNIYCVYSENDLAFGLTDYVVEEIGKNVYIQGAYDGSANEIKKMTSEKTESGVENKEDTTSTTVFTICVPEEYEETFLMAGLKGKYIVTKVLYPGDKVIFGTDVTYRETLKTGEMVADNSNIGNAGATNAGEMSVDLELASLNMVAISDTSIDVTDANGATAVLNIKDKIPEVFEELLTEDETNSLTELYDAENKDEYFAKVKELLIAYNIKVSGTIRIEDADNNNSESDIETTEGSEETSNNDGVLDKTSDKFRFVQYQKSESGDLIGVLTDADKDANGEYPYVVTVDFSDDKYKAGVDGYDDLKAAGFEDAVAVQAYLSQVAQAYKEDDSMVFSIE